MMKVVFSYRDMSMRLIKLSKKKERGQVAISVILLSAVLVLIGVALASRTTRDISLSTQTKESSVVLSAVESGAEQALSQVISAVESGGTTPEAVVTGTQSITTEDGVQVDVDYEIKPQNYLELRVPVGEDVMIDLRDSTGKPNYQGSLDVYWGKADSCSDRASLVITTYYRESGTLKSRYLMLGPSCVNRGDRFIQVPETDNPLGYRHHFVLSDLNFSTDGSGNGDLYVVFKPLYADADLKVVGGANLPTQQYVILSRGESQGDTTEVRSVRIDYTLPVPPGVIDYAVYSGDTLVK